MMDSGPDSLPTVARLLRTKLVRLIRCDLSFPMRSFWTACCFCVLATFAKAEIRFVHVWGNYRTADSFVRISEYFTGHEEPGHGQTLLRTQPRQRGGYYFLSRVKNTDAEISGAKIELQIITARNPAAVKYDFPIDVPRGQHVYQVGLTGTDWPTLDEQPVAWKMSLFSSDGKTLAEEQSFAWSKPDGTR